MGATSAALAAMLGARAVGAQCCGDGDGDGAVTVNEILTAVNRALEGFTDDGICSTESCPAQLAGCTGCTDVTQATCSCALFFGYWSSTTFRDYPFSAWYVFFGAGYTFGNNKDASFAVPAVRGGL